MGGKLGNLDTSHNHGVMSVVNPKYIQMGVCKTQQCVFIDTIPCSRKPWGWVLDNYITLIN